MKSNVKRREFLKKGTLAGISSCILFSCPKLLSMDGLCGQTDDEIPDPEKLEYCGYKCPDDCQFLKASIENDVELKKEAYELWKIKERFGVDFDPEKIFCYGCKTQGKPEGVVLQHCTVRECVISKGLNCCIECDELTACEKDLWTRFPEFKKQVIEMQKKYFEASKT